MKNIDLFNVREVRASRTLNKANVFHHSMKPKKKKKKKKMISILYLHFLLSIKYLLLLNT